jgi:hypothetical protein
LWGEGGRHDDERVDAIGSTRVAVDEATQGEDVLEEAVDETWARCARAASAQIDHEGRDGVGHAVRRARKRQDMLAYADSLSSV